MFAAIEAMFAMIGLAMTGFPGYIITMLVCMFGYVGARDFISQHMRVYGMYSWVVAFLNLLFIIMFMFTDDNADDSQKGFVTAAFVDGMLNAWIARVSFRMSATLRALKEGGATRGAAHADLRTWAQLLLLYLEGGGERNDDTYFYIRSNPTAAATGH